MEELKSQENKPHAYYLGDLMGTLQYKKNYETIKQLTIPVHDYTHEQYTLGYTLDVHSFDNLQRLTPDTKNGKQRWKILLVMKKIEEGTTHLKGALLNLDTNEIALMTSFDNKEYILQKGNRSIKSLDEHYFIGHYRLLAPLFFWEELKNRLNY